MGKKFRGLRIEDRISRPSACALTRRLCNVLGYEASLFEQDLLYLPGVGSYGYVLGESIRRSNPHVRHDARGGTLLGFAPDSISEEPVGFVCVGMFRVAIAKAGDVFAARLVIREDYIDQELFVVARNLFGHHNARPETWEPKF